MVIVAVSLESLFRLMYACERRLLSLDGESTWIPHIHHLGDRHGNVPYQRQKARTHSHQSRIQTDAQGGNSHS